MVEPVLFDWLSLLIRWVHIITAAAWIGTSFYFIFLDLSLRRDGALPAGVAGDSWQVHGGGFYHMQKYEVAPAELPKELHWFKYEAYFTWITGFLLLILLYYVGAELYLIDPFVRELSATTATTIGIGSLIVGWIIYDLLCRSPLGRNELALSIVIFVLLVAASWGYTLVFSGRGAFMHAGALIGTIMVANVFFVIIPNQKKIVAAMIAGEEPDPAHGARGKQRSVHNNYLTLPVIFVMVSNHHPITFESRWSWLILAGVIIVGGLIRHFYNLKHAGKGAQWWLWPVAAVFIAGAVFLSVPREEEIDLASLPEVSFTEARRIIDERCTVCHSVEPTFEGFEKPPAGVVFDTTAEIERSVNRIRQQTIRTRAMPLGNITEMTEEERTSLAAWIARGAIIE